MSERWVMAYEHDGTSWDITEFRLIGVGQRLAVGRTGDLRLGVKVPSPSVSRHAMTVTATAYGWELAITNRNGAIIHPWCQPTHRATGVNQIDWPLVAVRMLTSTGATQHWVLLEYESPFMPPGGYTGGSEPGQPGGATTTALASNPRDLTKAEFAALRAVFGAQMAWPPVAPAEPMLLKQAAARIGISISGLQDRLKSAQARAIALGLDRTVGLTDPAYLYLLARAGFIQPPMDSTHRPAH
jgi:hypothetical protein